MAGGQLGKAASLVALSDAQTPSDIAAPRAAGS